MSPARGWPFWLGLSWASVVLGAPGPGRCAEALPAPRPVATDLVASGAIASAPGPLWDWPGIFDRVPLRPTLPWSRNACAPTAAGWDLGADRRQQVRAGGVVETPFRLAIAAAACYRLRAVGAAVGFAGTEDGYAPASAEGRRPAGYGLGLRLDYPLLDRAARVGLLFDLDALDAPTQRLGRLALTAAGRPLVLQLPDHTVRLGFRVSF